MTSNETLQESVLAAPAGSLRELLHVAFPLMISAGSLSVMNVVDRAFLSILNVDALAASMPASMMVWTVMSLPFGVASYTNAFVAQYEGAQNKAGVAAAMWQGLFVALLGGLFVLLMIFLATPLFAALGHTPAVQKLEVEYFVWLIPSSLPLMLNTVLAAFFAARKETAIVMYVNVSTSVLNGILDYLFIFGKGPFPEMGIGGAAIGTVIAQAIATAIFIDLLRRQARSEGYPFRKTFRLEMNLVRRMLRYGIPNGVQMVLDVGAFTTFLVLVGRLGTQAQAATNLAFTLNSLAFVPMLGMGTAVLTLVGRRIGEKKVELANRTVWNAMGISGAYMLLFAAIYLAIPELILSPFLQAEDQLPFEEIRPLVVELLRFVAVYTLFDAMAIVFGSAIRGAGETRFSMIFTVLTSWCLMVLPTLWAIRSGQGLKTCWLAATTFIIVLGTGFMLRYMQGKWKSVPLIGESL